MEDPVIASFPRPLAAWHGFAAFALCQLPSAIRRRPRQLETGRQPMQVGVFVSGIQIGVSNRLFRADSAPHCPTDMHEIPARHR
jgi:hypothetical protein